MNTTNIPVTSDAIITMDGLIQLDAGTYRFKVNADDGYEIRINGVTVAIVDKIQSPTSDIHAEFIIPESGLQKIEIIYWDQGGDYVFEPSLSKDGGSFEQLSTFTLSNGFNTPEDTAITFEPTDLFANDSDPDNDSLSLSTDPAHPAVSNPVNGTVAVVDGKIVFTPNDNYYGPAQFDYTISDGNGGFDTATVYLTVTPVDDGPITDISDIDAAANTVSELASIGESTGIHADATAPNGGVVIYSLSNDANNRFAIDSSTGEITVNEAFDGADVGNHTVTVNALAEDGTTSTKDFVITITENNAPVINDATFTEQGNANQINFNLSDYVTDVEDDSDATQITNIIIKSLPHESFGTLVKVNGDGSTTPVALNEELPESTQLRYIENDTSSVDASFNAITEFAPAHGSNTVDSFTSSTGIILTGGSFDGASPTGTLTAGTLNYDGPDDVNNGQGLGVNGGELEGSGTSNEYISASFTNGDVSNVTLALSSVGGNFANGSVDAVVKIALFKDGVQVGEILSYEDLNTAATDTNQPIITIDSAQEFDELRLFMTSTSSTSSMLLRSIEVNETVNGDKFTFSAIDANGKESNEVATVNFTMTPDTIDTIDAINDQASGVISKSQQSGEADKIESLGQDGEGQINGDPGLEEQTRVIDLGVENAGKSVTLSFDALIQGGWENDQHGHTADRFYIEANGTQLDNRTYISGAPGTPDYNNSSWTYADNGLSYQVTLDSQGRANLKFSVASTMTTEVVDVTNISVTLNEVELSTVLVDVVANDETLDGTVTVSLPSNSISVNGNVVGTLSLVGNKVLFTPNEQILTLTESELAQLAFDYTISDGTTSDTATVSLDLRIADATSSQTIGSSLNDQIVVQQGEFSAPDQNRLSFSYGGTDGKYTQQGSSELTDAGNNRTGQSHSSTSAQTIDARAGNDYVEAASGNDIIFAGDSNSVLDADASVNIGTHGLITDALDSITQDQTELLRNDLVSNPQLDIVNAGNGDDIIYGQAGSDLLYGHTGNDYIDGGIGNDGLRGGEGNDTLFGRSGNNWLIGDMGNDTLIGGDGNDTIIAGLGNDIVVSGLGNDTLKSGQGSNTFLWLANELGTDTIENFTYGEDKIDLIDLLGLESDQSLDQYLSINFEGGDTIISVDTNLNGNEKQDIILSDTDLSSHAKQSIINTLFTKLDENEGLFSSISVEETPPNFSALDDDSLI